MMTEGFTIRSTTAADWREIRELRLEMLRDTPLAFGETFDVALAHDEAEWTMRGARGTTEHSIVVVAIAPSGRWIGTMAGYIPDEATGPLLVGVYVAPDYRGGAAGVTDALLSRIEDWALTESGRLTLHVHEHNDRARAAYEHRGFAATGVTAPYDLDPTTRELEMVKQLTAQRA
ncbi:GNAT family N-acetyltransferase [Cryobacterium zhongshanensis]|uniref:GNAT family N-acetyltransferase n=1 Tax=Cryobacterium zhongshanensis TaxID=2928153 RepID=A0AA41UGL3_9MICO|nr:GNAT family N-acetyltransferase [Cryobacterium zhongshanensis]MCI4659302.1 GNAT family N-acetyltransferase [Cryobacterium zhongshanensis]